MFKRFWNYIKQLLSGGLDKLEDPEVLLSQAQREMQEVQARNRERAVQAITAKNNLQQQVDDTDKRISMLQQKAELAVKRGENDLALQILKEKQSYESTLGVLKQNLAQAVETSETIKANIKRDEERIKQKTAEALALKAQWQSNKIQIEMEKALNGFGSIDDTTQAFERATAKIKNANSEASARAEIGKTRIENRMSALDITEQDVNAENELELLKAKMGMPTTPVPTQRVTTSADSDIEKQLAELEAKVGVSGNNGK